MRMQAVSIYRLVMRRSILTIMRIVIVTAIVMLMRTAAGKSTTPDMAAGMNMEILTRMAQSISVTTGTSMTIMAAHSTPTPTQVYTGSSIS